MNNDIVTIRHSLSHIMASAVQELYPKVKLGIGPAIENGFYYDFDFEDTKLTPEDLPKIEEKMRELMSQNLKFQRRELSKKEALGFFKNNPYKLELVKEISDEEVISTYQSGDFEDLCRGPHVASSQEINPQAFKLIKLAGAYWRCDEKQPMLTRIYGLAFETEKELQDYLHMLEEAEKRDHRKLGKELDLFVIDPTVGMGLSMWLPKGAILWRIMEDYWYREHLKNGYELVRSPHIGSRNLWEMSGHWGFYNESMYPPLEVSQTLKDAQEGNTAKVKEEYLLKPMNCPFHVVLFNSRPRSYRDLPLRWAECGTVYRYEKSGELSGLTRVRGFTQDDAHIICAKEQVEDELKRTAKFILKTLKDFGFSEYNVYLSLRDPKNKVKYAGDDNGWEFTQETLEKVAREVGIDCKKEEGEAAFYGPKLDFKIKDCLGREWQCSTLQFDFNLPKRFAMSFVNSRGEKEMPFMLHRVLFGSFERFIGVLIEHYAGAFPVWLAPVQAWVIPVSEKHQDYSQQVAQQLKEAGIRTEAKTDAETVGKKIREGELQKIPYLLVVGDKEAKAKTVAVRKHNEDLGAMSLDEFLTKLPKRVSPDKI